ncbi:MAG: NAD-dependent epimerase/dehydratase family protein [Bacteroidia bacterium]|nr:NAD-dependent epimerase/dehydratase family protein [Bacteroidia bacterium]
MILVTGGTGMVGTHILLALTQQGHRVRALKRQGSSITETEKTFRYYSQRADELLSRIEWTEGDVMDIFSLEEALKDVTHVYHAAAMVSFDPKDRDTMLKINMDGTANIVNLSMDYGVKKFCHVSSVAALGKTIDLQNINEDTWWKNDPSNSWYAISKYNAEREVWRASEEGMDVIIVNPSVIVGAGNTSRSSNAIFALAKKGFSWYTKGSGGFVDAQDVADACVKLMDSEIVNERFVLNSENMSYRNFANEILTLFGKKPVSRQLGKFVLGIMWRIEKIVAALSGKPPRITKESVAAASEAATYNGSRITQRTGFSYKPIRQSLQEVAGYYR